MIPRIRRVSFAVLVLLTVASACLAAEEKPAHRAGNGSVGGQIGASYFGADRFVGNGWFGDYSDGTMPRFSFAGQFRYITREHWRLQVSPGYTWSAYKPIALTFTDQRFPTDEFKNHVLTQVVPVTAQLQYVHKRGNWYYHAGLGAGVYRVWVENRRHVLLDSETMWKHRGLYPGGVFEFGAERFLKAITTTSVELTWANHLVFVQRDDQFKHGFNSNLMTMEWRVGINYYFDPLRDKTQGIAIPGVK